MDFSTLTLVYIFLIILKYNYVFSVNIKLAFKLIFIENGYIIMKKNFMNIKTL